MANQHFIHIENAQAILVKNGIFKPCPLYVREDRVYALYGGGFVYLTQNGKNMGTSTPKVRVDAIIADFVPTTDAMGRMLVSADMREAITSEFEEVKALPKE